jgi:hypothetical protein
MNNPDEVAHLTKAIPITTGHVLVQMLPSIMEGVNNIEMPSISGRFEIKFDKGQNSSDSNTIQTPTTTKKVPKVKKTIKKTTATKPKAPSKRKEKFQFLSEGTTKFIRCHVAACRLAQRQHAAEATEKEENIEE